MTLIDEVVRRLGVGGVDLSWYAGKHCLVTGGAGFIGSWLVEALARLGGRVFVVDNLWRGSTENLRMEDGRSSIDVASQFREADLRDPEVARMACAWAEPDIIFHLADVVAGVDFVLVNEAFILRSNVLINSNTFQAVREYGNVGLVYVGTACSYPRSLQAQVGGAPLKEDQVLPADPESAYGWSKLMGEYEAALLARETEIPVGVLRLHNVYGPRASLSRRRSQVVPSLIRKAVLYPQEEFVVWGSGQQTRDFVYVGDVVDALLRTPVLGMGKGVIQISTAVETSVADLASMIVAASGKDIPVRFDPARPEGDRGRSGDNGRARDVLGWQPSTSLVLGLRATYEWASQQLSAERADLEA